MTELTASLDEPASVRLAAALRRARADFLEMPGMQLTRTQARRLWALDTYTCETVLATLVENRFLTMTRKETFGRPSF